MVSMEYLELLKNDLHKWMRAGILAVPAFLLLCAAIWYFSIPRIQVRLHTQVLEYGQSVRTAALVEGIGEYAISSQHIVSDTLIQVGGFEVSFEEVDTQSLGSQHLVFEFSDPQIRPVKKQIQVVDTTPPEIRLETEEISIPASQYSQGLLLSLPDLSDNYSRPENIRLTGKEERESLDENAFVFVFEAVDENSNRTQKRVQVLLEEEEIPEEVQPDTEIQEAGQEMAKQPESEEETDLEPARETEPASVPAAAPSVPPAMQSQPETTWQTPLSQPAPADRDFLFSQGYNMDSVSAACSQALFQANAPGACVPLQSADGLYIGMRLTFY